MWKIIGTILIFQIHVILGKLTGNHVCLTEESDYLGQVIWNVFAPSEHRFQQVISYPANVTEYRLRNATLRNYKWCMNVPPRCSYYTVKTINESKIVEKILTRTVEKCCEGYIEENETCVLKCIEGCENGKCNDGKCVCSTGFKGNTCDVGCDLGSWGPNCSNNCDCKDKTCDPINGTCFQISQTTIASLPKPSTPINISINGNESRISTTSPGTSTTRGTSLVTERSTYAFEISSNITSAGTVRTGSGPSSTTATPKEDKLTESPNSISVTQTTKLTSPNSKGLINVPEASTHMIENTTASYQPKQTLNVSVTTSQFYSTSERITSPKDTDFTAAVSPELNTFEANSVKFVTIASKKVSDRTESRFLDTTATVGYFTTKSTTLTTSRPTEDYFNKSMNVKPLVTTASNEINNLRTTESKTFFVSKSSVTPYSNDITDLHKTESYMKMKNTTPLATSSGSTESTIAHSITTSTPRHAEDHLDKPTALTNSIESISNTTKEANLDGISKEYTIPVEVKYENPTNKKEMASTHENYAEEKNYLTLEDRGYINKHVSLDSEYFVNSFTAAAIFVLIVAVSVMMFLGWNSWRGKRTLENRNAGRKDAAVYTTSIFHTPLPDPPVIENPTYLLTTIDCKKCNSDTVLLKAHPAYPIQRISQMGEVREYMYDHPPSTGSYRAASAVDPGDVSSCYAAGTEIAEPVYDEIPLRNGTGNTEPNMCLYVNTVGRTKF